MAIRTNRLGEINYNKKGEKMIIVEYHDSQNITVQFENGLLKHNIQYAKFSQGSVANPSELPENRIGEVNYNTFGLRMEIIEYTDCRNLIVKFDNGYIAKTAYKEFKNGHVKNLLHKGYDKTGEVGCNNQGKKMVVIKYTSSEKMTVEFENGYITECTYQNFKLGRVRDYYDKEIWGFGCLGEGIHKPSINGKSTKKYRMWHGMIQRCYSSKYHKRHPTYKDCSVSEAWYNFQDFGDWFDENYYEVEGLNMQLDKDILVKGNKIYSPETCIIVPRNINLLFTKTDAKRGDYPIGVSFNKRNNAFDVCCCTGKGGTNWIGSWKKDQEKEAFQAYKEYKEKVIKEVADLYKDKIPQKLYDALYRYEVEITD